MKAVIVSKQDPAGMNIFSKLLEKGFKETSEIFDENPVYELREKGMKLFQINQDQIYADYVDKINCDCLIFASKHSSLSKKPTLTVHPIGNWGKAELGGKNFELVKTSASLMKAYLKKLKNLKDKLPELKEYDISYEATHHGPFLSKPALYIEIGSCKEQWLDEIAGKAIAETIINADKEKCKTAIGFGGLHYNPHFTRIALETEYCFSHMCAKHSLKELNPGLVSQAIEKTLEKADCFVIEKKGLAGEREKIMKILQEFDLPVLRADKIR